MIVILTVTGHRPDQLGGFKPQVWTSLVALAKDKIGALKPLEVWTGGALGWDQACCEACVQLDIPFTLVLPCLPFNYCARWAPQSQSYFNMLYDKSIAPERRHAESVMVMDAEYKIENLNLRNKFMIDNCDLVLALYSGVKQGGTANAVSYANQCGKPIVNVWDDYHIPA